MTIKVLVADDETEGGRVGAGPVRPLRRFLLLLLYGVGAATMVLILSPWLGWRLALPVGVAAFAVYLMLPTYRDRR